MTYIVQYPIGYLAYDNSPALGTGYPYCSPSWKHAHQFDSIKKAADAHWNAYLISQRTKATFIPERARVRPATEPFPEISVHKP